MTKEYEEELVIISHECMGKIASESKGMIMTHLSVELGT